MSTLPEDFRFGSSLGTLEFLHKKRGETFVPPLSESESFQLLVGEVDAHREVVGFHIAEIASAGIHTCNGTP